MPVYLTTTAAAPPGSFRACHTYGESRANYQSDTGSCLRIGLVNNMPDPAVKATERQFVALLDSASEGIVVQLSLHTLPGVPRDDATQGYLRRSYSSVETLYHGALDGLIVTGREPLTPNLRDEPYWRSFTKLVHWAQANTRSSIWSCLAAHAAVLHMDGIVRVRRKEKLFGVFESGPVLRHSLTTHAPGTFTFPHSRWNTIPEACLADHGYGTLTSSARTGADTFIREQESLFIFFQGHPEYEPDTLLREFRRDVARYVRGETCTYPLLPENYFGDVTADRLASLGRRVARSRDASAFAEMSLLLEEQQVESTWKPTGFHLYRAWLQHLALRKGLTVKAEEAGALVA